MYNGGNGSNYRNGDTTSTQESGKGFQIKPMYLYIGIGLLALIAILFVIQFLRTSFVMHYGLAAGLLLLLANLREYIGRPYGQIKQTALLNSLIGGGLVFAWLTQFLGWLLWVPALGLLLAAAPLALGRASIYNSYIQTVRGAAENVRRTLNRRV